MKKLIALATGLNESEVAWFGLWPIFTTIMQWWNWKKWTLSHMSRTCFNCCRSCAI